MGASAKFKRTVGLGLLAKDMARLKAAKKSPNAAALRKRVIERLGLLHGLPQKIGQLLSFKELEQGDPAFRTLTEGPAELSLELIQSILATELGKPAAALFKQIHPDGISASIGQVHQATTHDDRVVAVKVQYPGIAEAIAHDLNALGWLMTPVGNLRKGFDMAAYRAEIGTVLHAETDYLREADALHRFRRHAATLRVPGCNLIVPEPVPSLSNDRILTSSWEQGDHAEALVSWPQPRRTEIASALLHWFWNGLLAWKEIHADPHPGNYRFRRRPDGSDLVILDFGCVRAIPPGLASGVASLARLAQHDNLDEQGVWNAFLEMQFNEAQLARLRPRLVPAARILMAPLLTPLAFNTRSWNLAARLKECLGDDRMNFRMAGPPHLIYLARSLHGLCHYLALLDVSLPWRAVVAPLLDALPTAPPHRSTSPTSAPAAASAAATPPAPAKKIIARELRIRITERGQQRLAITFNAEAVDELAELMPPEALEKAKRHGIDLAGITSKAQQSHYAPGTLAEFTDAGRTYRIWLE